MKKLFVVGFMLMTMFTWASTIHTFANGEALTAANLNSVLQHIHNTMVGGHGARLVDADVSASAALTQSKITDFRNFPRAWGYIDINDGCVTANIACTFAVGSSSKNHVTSVTRTVAGSWQVVLDYTPTNAGFGVVISPMEAAGAAGRACSVVSLQTTTPQFTVKCFDLATPTAANVGFSFSVFDND